MRYNITGHQSEVYTAETNLSGKSGVHVNGENIKLEPALVDEIIEDGERVCGSYFGKAQAENAGEGTVFKSLALFLHDGPEDLSLDLLASYFQSVLNQLPLNVAGAIGDRKHRNLILHVIMFKCTTRLMVVLCMLLAS